MAAVKYETTFNDVFIKKAECTVCCKLRDYWGSSPQDDFTDTSFKAQSMLAIEKRKFQTAAGHKRNMYS